MANNQLASYKDIAAISGTTLHPNINRIRFACMPLIIMNNRFDNVCPT